MIVKDRIDRAGQTQTAIDELACQIEVAEARGLDARELADRRAELVDVHRNLSGVNAGGLV
jgi:hypothetical protein